VGGLLRGQESYIGKKWKKGWRGPKFNLWGRIVSYYREGEKLLKGGRLGRGFLNFLIFPKLKKVWEG